MCCQMSLVRYPERCIQITIPIHAFIVPVFPMLHTFFNSIVLENIEKWNLNRAFYNSKWYLVLNYFLKSRIRKPKCTKLPHSSDYIYVYVLYEDLKNIIQRLVRIDSYAEWQTFKTITQSSRMCQHVTPYALSGERALNASFPDTDLIFPCASEAHRQLLKDEFHIKLERFSVKKRYFLPKYLSIWKSSLQSKVLSLSPQSPTLLSPQQTLRFMVFNLSHI